MLRGRDIVIIASIDWNFLWQGHQEIASRLAQAGNRVLYIENTGVRAPGVADLGRVRSRLSRWIKSLASQGVRQVAPNLWVCAPLALPPFGARWQRRLNRRLFLPLVRRAARRLKLRPDVIWTYLPTDTALDLIDLLRRPRGVVLYYCIADFGQLAPQVEALRRSEDTLLRRCDVVFAQGPELAADCERCNGQVSIFPFGVNIEAFAPRSPLEEAAQSDSRVVDEADCPPAMRGLARPVIGYIGGLHRHVDCDLLAAMARARPQWSWVFVGPLQTDVEELAALPNVHFLGQQAHAELVHYVRRFDVCTVPYVASFYTDTVVPTKINEYLAVGKPVVATPLPAVRAFNSQHDVLSLASARPEEFLDAIEAALRLPIDPNTLSHRREVATLGDWGERLEEMSRVIEAAQNRKKTR